MRASAIDYKSKFDETYFSGKSSFFYKLGYGTSFSQPTFNALFSPLKPYIPYDRKRKVLDLGCAYGFMLDRFPNNYQKFGIDISSYAIKKAKQRNPNTTFRRGNIQDRLLWNDNYFDIILMNDVLQYVMHPEKTLTDVYKKLKKSGIFYITTPNFGILRKKFYAYADKKEQYISLFHHTELTHMLQSIGFSVCESWTYFSDVVGIRFSHAWGTESAFICRKAS